MEGYKIEDGHRYDEYLFMEFFLKDKLHKLIYHKRRQIRELNVKMIKLRVSSFNKQSILEHQTNKLYS